MQIYSNVLKPFSMRGVKSRPTTSVWIIISLLIPILCSGQSKLLPPQNLKPQDFEPYLKIHPENEVYRSAALIWYFRREANINKLQEHTFQMIKYHPQNFYIPFENMSAFYASPAYRAKVISLLEKQVELGNHEPETYFNLAYICEKGAIPPLHTEEQKKRFLAYMSLPPSTKLLQSFDRRLAQKSEHYYKLSLKEAAKSDNQTAADRASEGLVSLHNAYVSRKK